MKVVGAVLGFVLLVAVIFGASLGMRYLGIQVEGFFQPLEQNVQRQVFEETKSYNEAKEQELIKYKFEYDKAEAKEDKATMSAIKSAVRNAFADYDESRLNPELGNFVRECKYGG